MLEIKHIYEIQHTYKCLLEKYRTVIRQRDLDNFRLKALVSEVKRFWLKNQSIVSFFMRHVEKDDNVAFLAGAVYLDIKNYGHYEYSLLGKIRIINDPIIKMSTLLQEHNLPI